MTTSKRTSISTSSVVVEAYRLDRYDNLTIPTRGRPQISVVEAYRLDRYDNYCFGGLCWS